MGGGGDTGGEDGGTGGGGEDGGAGGAGGAVGGAGGGPTKLNVYVSDVSEVSELTAVFPHSCELSAHSEYVLVVQLGADHTAPVQPSPYVSSR